MTFGFQNEPVKQIGEKYATKYCQKIPLHGICFLGEKVGFKFFYFSKDKESNIRNKQYTGFWF